MTGYFESGFFDYRSHYRTDVFHELTLLERFIPLVIIGIILTIIIKYKEQLKQNQKLDKIIVYVAGGLLTILYLSHYALRIALYGITDTIVLPFHFCSIAMFFCIVHLFTRNKPIHSFVLLAGVLGAVVSLTMPVIGYDARFYRYYQFMFAHGILFLAPLYFMIVHNQIPTKKDVIKAFIILDTLTLFMTIFNYYNNTDFFFMFLDPSRIEKFPMIKYFGGIPYYMILVQILALGYFYGAHRFFVYLRNKNKMDAI